MAARSRTFSGIAASPGVAIGRVLFLNRRAVKVPRFHIEDDQIDYEIERLRAAIDKSIEQLEAIRSKFTDGGMDHLAILEAHELMLRDQALFDEAVQFIQDDKRNAEWAVDKVIGRLRALFEKVTDPYFRERRNDLDFTAQRILKNLVGEFSDLTDLKDVQAGTIVVAHDLSPADTAQLTRHRISAFVTELGGKTSHTSIIARSLGVPAAVGVHGLMDAVGSGDMILVDGAAGLVIVHPTRAHLDQGRAKILEFQKLNLGLLEARDLPAKTLDGFETTIVGNIELPDEIAGVLDNGGVGVGLYRTEFLFLGRHEAPGEEDHYRTYCRMFDELGDRPVTIRTLDLGGDKIMPGMQVEEEPNPALGLRAIRYCFEHPELFEAQIAGLLRAAPRGDLRIMLPMISGLAELRKAKEMIAAVAKRLRTQGKEHRADIPIGIMLEVPSAVLTADLLAKEADFFSIGTNDLMQYLLAIDRTNDRVAYLYDPLHPAMLRTLKFISEVAEREGIPVSVCGEMAGEPLYTPILLAFGFEQWSMNAGSIPPVKRLTRDLLRSECVDLLGQALECRTRREVTLLVRDFISVKAPDLQELFEGTGGWDFGNE